MAADQSPSTQETVTVDADALAPLLTIAIEQADPVVVRLAGELDPATAPQLDEALRTVGLDGPPLVHVDMAGVSFMDSSGIRSLLVGAELLGRRDGRLRVVNADRQIVRILEVVGLEDLVDPG